MCVETGYSRIVKMAFDYRISAPCLLDYMDDAVLKSDISLGVLETEQALMKGSPSHESDSGCSDMLDEGSVSPSRSENSMSPGLFDLDVFSNQSVEDFDSELQSYLDTGNVLGSEEASFLQEPDLQINTVQPFSSVSPPIDVDDEDPDYIPPKSKRIIQSVAIRPNNVLASMKENLSRPTSFKPEVLRVLPSKAPLVSNQNSARTPAIKVVKVIKAPVASSSTDIDSVLHEALDERNRKNAVQAKINREKKKQYINSLEQEIEQLKADNCTLKEKNDEVISERDSLLEEVNYLKNILANQSALASLLKNIPGDPKVKLSSSFKRKISADHDYTREVKRSRSSASVGVCLHVDKDEVSLEFCAKCAAMAKS